MVYLLAVRPDVNLDEITRKLGIDTLAYWPGTWVVRWRGSAASLLAEVRRHLGGDARVVVAQIVGDFAAA
jgi:hypothetical protein